jgi:hypothetical protein
MRLSTCNKVSRARDWCVRDSPHFYEDGMKNIFHVGTELQQIHYCHSEAIFKLLSFRTLRLQLRRISK